jgi:hypothetical protein
MLLQAIQARSMAAISLCCACQCTSLDTCTSEAKPYMGIPVDPGAQLHMLQYSLAVQCHCMRHA